MRDRLKEAAKANNRTMNAEVVARLEQSLANTAVFFAEPEAQRVAANRVYEAAMELSKDPEFKQELLHMMAAALVVGKVRKLVDKDPDLELTAEEVLKDIKSLAATEAAQARKNLKNPGDH